MENIYMKGECDDNGKINLWKYSISSRTFSTIPCPPSCGNEEEEDEIYLLAVHKSSLLLLNAIHTSPKPRREPEKMNTVFRTVMMIRTTFVLKGKREASYLYTHTSYRRMDGQIAKKGIILSMTIQYTAKTLVKIILC